MKILYYGVFDGRQWRSEYPMAEGLEALGHHLIRCNFRSWWPGVVSRVWRRHQAEIDLVFLQNGIPFSPKWLAPIHKPLVFMASEFAVSSAQHILDSPRPPDLVLAHSEQTHQYCRQKGIPSKRVHHAYNHKQYHHIPSEYSYDVCFIGGKSPKRASYLEMLKSKGYRTLITTTGDARKINRIYNSSKVVLHIHRKDESYIPTRLFEVMPTQGCLLIEDLKSNADPELGEDFYETFTTCDDMLQKIDYLLSHEAYRKDKVEKAQSLAPRHTWAARMKFYSESFQEVLDSKQFAGSNRTGEG